MHELSRHVIHIAETLRVAARVMEAIDEDRRLSQLKGASGQESFSPVKAMKYRLSNLEDRAQAFVSRLNNEIQLVSVTHIMRITVDLTIPGFQHRGSCPAGKHTQRWQDFRRYHRPAHAHLFTRDLCIRA